MPLPGGGLFVSFGEEILIDSSKYFKYTEIIELSVWRIALSYKVVFLMEMSGLITSQLCQHHKFCILWNGSFDCLRAGVTFQQLAERTQLQVQSESLSIFHTVS